MIYKTGSYSDWKAAGECSVTCGSNGQQKTKRTCIEDESAAKVPRDKPLFCGSPEEGTRTCSVETQCPGKKVLLVGIIENVFYEMLI